jgi:hypothetical protein
MRGTVYVLSALRITGFRLIEIIQQLERFVVKRFAIS